MNVHSSQLVPPPGQAKTIVEPVAILFEFAVDLVKSLQQALLNLLQVSLIYAEVFRITDRAKRRREPLRSVVQPKTQVLLVLGIGEFRRPGVLAGVLDTHDESTLETLGDASCIPADPHSPGFTLFFAPTRFEVPWRHQGDQQGGVGRLLQGQTRRRGLIETLALALSLVQEE